jgi:hypothetical protein
MKTLAIGTIYVAQNGKPLILNLTLHPIDKLCNMDAEYWCIDVKLLPYLDTVF